MHPPYVNGSSRSQLLIDMWRRHSRLCSAIHICRYSLFLVLPPVAAICGQGYESLIRESFSYTDEVLMAGQQRNVPVRLITNGTRLADYVSDLEGLKPLKIHVSLDAGTAEAHDRQRGRKGAFEATLNGLRQAVGSTVLRDVLCVTSVLIPKKRDQLMGMPAPLRRPGIGHWIVNPLIKVGRMMLPGQTPVVFHTSAA